MQNRWFFIGIVCMTITGCTTETLPQAPVEPVVSETKEEKNVQKTTYSIQETGLYDGKIIAHTANGTDKVLVESLRGVLPSDAPKNLTLRLMTTVESKEYMIFQEQLMDTEDQGGKLWKFSLVTNTWKELTAINAQYQGWGARVWNDTGDKVYYVLDQESGAEAGVSTTLWEADMTKEEVQKIATLEEGETFNGGYGALSSSFDLRWHIPEVELSIAVFTHIPEGEGEKVRKEYRVFPIPTNNESE